jgi:hypothetical protein
VEVYDTGDCGGMGDIELMDSAAGDETEDENDIGLVEDSVCLKT